MNKLKNKINVILNDYKKTINWLALIIWYISFTTVYLFIEYSWGRFFDITSVFFVLTLFVWLQHYLLRLNIK